MNINPWDRLTEVQTEAIQIAFDRADQALAEARDAMTNQTDERLTESSLAKSLPRARRNLCDAFEQVSQLMELASIASECWLAGLEQTHPTIPVTATPIASSQSRPADLTETHP